MDFTAIMNRFYGMPSEGLADRLMREAPSLDPTKMLDMPMESITPEQAAIVRSAGGTIVPQGPATPLAGAPMMPQAPYAATQDVWGNPLGAQMEPQPQAPVTPAASAINPAALMMLGQQMTARPPQASPRFIAPTMGFGGMTALRKPNWYGGM